MDYFLAERKADHVC